MATIIELYKFSPQEQFIPSAEKFLNAFCTDLFMKKFMCPYDGT